MSESRNGNAADAQSYSSLRDLRDVPEATAEPGLRALGELLHGMRRAKGWSRRQLSELAGVDPDTISNAELAEHVPRPDTLRRLALALIESEAPWVTLRGDAPSVPASTPAAPDAEHQAASAAAEVSTARDGCVLVEKTIVTTETWRAPGQRAVPEEDGDGAHGS